jgi:hypothetical protein
MHTSGREKESYSKQQVSLAHVYWFISNGFCKRVEQTLQDQQVWIQDLSSSFFLFLSFKIMLSGSVLNQ